jgi:hypothetical protein
VTYETIPYATKARPELVNDRRGGLVAFGVVSILIGMPPALVSASMALVLARMLTVGDPGGLPIVGAILAVAVIAAAVFIWTGVGSIRCRRWVRPVVLGIGWPTGVTSLLMAAGILIYANDRSDEGYVAFAVVIMIFGVLLPAGYLGFYTSEAVRGTLAAYDPSPSWTEATPLPVFVGCVSLTMFGLLTMALAVLRATPVFGVYVTRVPGAGLAVLAGAAMIASAALMYAGWRWGWWLAMGVVSGGFASAMVTMGRLGMMEFYRHGGVSTWTLEDLDRSRAMTGATPLVFVGVVAAISVNYLLWIRPKIGVRDGGGEDRVAAAVLPVNAEGGQ